MNERIAIIRMLKQLLEDSVVLHQQGAGYYSCVPIIRRYNKLLSKSRSLFPDGVSLIDSFDELEESDPKDPSDKMKIVQGIRIEAGQLISLLDSLGEVSDEEERED